MEYLKQKLKKRTKWIKLNKSEKKHVETIRRKIMYHIKSKFQKIEYAIKSKLKQQNSNLHQTQYSGGRKKDKVVNLGCRDQCRLLPPFFSFPSFFSVRKINLGFLYAILSVNYGWKTCWNWCLFIMWKN